MGVGGQRHDPAALPPGKRFGIHLIGGRVGSRAGLDGCRKSSPTGTVQPITSQYFFFFVKIYLQDVNTHTSVPDSTKIVPGQPIHL
jgi:hypothetical protein